MKRLIRSFRYGQKGFTLIELLVVVAILGVLAAVAVPNVGKFMGKGKSEAAETELHNVQTAVMAMMAESYNGVCNAYATHTRDMNLFTANSTVASGADLIADTYMSGLDSAGLTKTGKYYSLAADGTVSQHDS